MMTVMRPQPTERFGMRVRLTVTKAASGHHDSSRSEYHLPTDNLNAGVAP